MHLTALVSIALAVFTSALPHTGSERDLVYNAGRAGGGAGKRGNDNNDPQSSLSKCDEFSLASTMLTPSI